MSTQKIIILVVALIVLGVIAYFIAISVKPKTVVVDPGQPATPGLGGLLANLFGGDWFTNLFNRDEPAPLVKLCDCTKPGFDANGNADFNCRVGGLFYDQECI